MKNVCISFEACYEVLLEDSRRGQKVVGYQVIRCHMIFDINMDGRFTRKYHYVDGVHTTDPPSYITHSSVVSRDSIRLVFTLAALNSVEIRAAGIRNSYLNTKCREKIWTFTGLSLAVIKVKSC